METWQTPEYKQRYWEEKKKQYERGQEFIHAIKPGDVIRIERYSITNETPYSLSKYADIHTTQTVKIYAVHAQEAHPWFTTNYGDAIEAEAVIKWHKVPQQQTLGL